MLDKLGKGVQIAESHRDARKHKGFLADMFHGRLALKHMFPWPSRAAGDVEKEAAVMLKLRELLREIDPEAVDAAHEIPYCVFEELAEKGFFRLKLPSEIAGGEGLTQTAYDHVVGLAASYSSAIAILISADNTIGAKFPVLKHGTPEQKERYLPALAKWPSGFCFTEDLVGSDPASMQTFAVRVNDRGTAGYRLWGQKWYTTNAPWDDYQPLAEYLAVVAKIGDTREQALASDCFGIFIVPANSPGITTGPRNTFSGMRGIYNANPIFEDVWVASEGRIGKEGEGFRIALEALNTGRIAIASACVAIAKQALANSLWYGMKRNQWGKPIGEHQAIGKMLEFAASQIFAMEAMTEYASMLTDEGRDARLAAAACKVFASERAWTIVDNMMQIFGGRGYETYASLSKREKAVPVERIFRDARPNRIFEGSTQILSQWYMREGLDGFLKRGKVFLEEGSYGKKFAAGASFGAEYLRLCCPSFAWTEEISEELIGHLVFIESATRKFSRELISHAGRYREKLMFKQLTLERFFWIAAELHAMTASCAYAGHLSAAHGSEPVELADMFCRDAILRIDGLFRSLRENNDDASDGIASGLRNGKYAFLRDNIMPFAELEFKD